MRNQVTEDTKTSGRDTWNEFMKRWKGLVKIVGGIIAVLGIFSILANWIVDQKVEALREKLSGEINTNNAELAALRNQISKSDEGTESRTTTLDVDIGENNRRISDNGERLARMESTLRGTTGRLDRLYTRVTKNTEAILKAGGTPDVKMGGTPD